MHTNLTYFVEVVSLIFLFCTASSILLELLYRILMKQHLVKFEGKNFEGFKLYVNSRKAYSKEIIA